MNNREKMMRNLAAAKFTLWEIHLYLDTHPEDIAMISAYKKYESKYMMILHEYEEKYGAISIRDAHGVEWLKDPWPWDGKVCD